MKAIHYRRINLRDNDSATGAIPVPNGATRISASLSTTAGSTYVVTMQYSLSVENDEGENDMSNWITTGRTLSASLTIANAPTAGRGNLRFRTTTADTAADTAAILVVLFEG